MKKFVLLTIFGLATLNNMINHLTNILSIDTLLLKNLLNQLSSVLEPYAMKVASTLIRGECYCEVMFLPDNKEIFFWF